MSKQLRLGRQRGVGLIEVLVAVLVLSIGLLGMAALQSRSLADNNGAMARSMAVVASYSMFDAMRADEAGLAANAYDGASVDTSSCGSQSTGTLAGVNLHNWCAVQLTPLGAGATGSISALGDLNYEITIQFSDEQGQGAGGSTRQTTIVTRSKL